MFLEERDYKTVIDLQEIKRLQDIFENRQQQRYDAGRFIPSDLEPTSNGTQVGLRIVGHTLANYFTEERLRGTFLGSTLKTLDQNLNAELAIKTADSRGQKALDHSLKFQVEASQAMASLRYKGYTDAALIYRLDQEALRLTISQNLFAEVSLVVEHLESRHETLDQVRFSWNW